ACSASEDRVENDAGSGREPGCIVEGLADNFVTRNERHRHDGAQIQRGMAGQRREIAAADAGQARAHTDPLVESQRWRVAMHEAQWRQGPGKSSGKAVAHCPGSYVSRKGAIALEGA